MSVRAIVFCLIAVFGATQVHAREGTRIDASSDAAADQSYVRMLRECSREKQKRLAAALIELNFAGTHSAYEVVNDPKKQTASAANIKDKIAGMNADEIIAFAAASRKPGDPTVEVH